MESDLIVEYINYINEAYCSCVQCFANGKKVEHVQSMIFDVRGQTKEGLMKFCGNVILYHKDRMLFHLGYQPLQEILIFWPRISIKNLPQIVFLPPCPTWPKCHFGQVDLDPTILCKSFWLVFFIGYFLLNHHDNNIIWITTTNIYYLNYVKNLIRNNNN